MKTKTLRRIWNTAFALGLIGGLVKLVVLITNYGSMTIKPLDLSTPTKFWWFVGDQFIWVCFLGVVLVVLMLTSDKIHKSK